MVEPRLAATVVPLRDAPQGLEVLLLRRNAALAFAGGAWVFPGGRVDPGDWPSAEPDSPAGPPRARELSAASRAAAREAREEAGLRLVAQELVPVSHWTTPASSPKRFATWFFLGVAGDQRIQIDGSEIHEHRWVAPGQAVAAYHAKALLLITPTYATLEALQGFDRAEDAMAHYRAREPELVPLSRSGQLPAPVGAGRTT